MMLRLMRFDKPIGTILLFWPVCWALLLAYHNHPPITMIIVFTLGAILARAAGCIVNDLFDRRFDAHVARTHDRPLAAGTVSMQRALAWLAILMLGLIALLPWLNTTNRWLALLAVALTAFYPLTKRFFPFPQLILGITFNLGVVMVFVQANSFSTTTLWLYAASIAWTFAYDTVYALADIHDDARLGLHSSARTLGKWISPAIALSYAVMFICLGWSVNQPLMGTILGLISAVSYACVHTKIARVPIAFFKANGWIGAAIACALLFAR